jgi:hypothetical protein
MLKGDAETYRERCAELDQGGWDGFGLVVSAAFYIAVQEKFGGSWATADVIDFVAEARKNIQHTSSEIDPTVAEVLILAALTGNTGEMEKLETGLIVETEMLLIWNLLGLISDGELEDFLIRSGALAQQWSEEEETPV